MLGDGEGAYVHVDTPDHNNTEIMKKPMSLKTMSNLISVRDYNELHIQDT